MPASSSWSFIRRTASFVGSSTASSRRITVIGRITSRYLPRTYTSRSTSSAMPQIKLLTFNALTRYLSPSKTGPTPKPPGILRPRHHP